MNATEPIRRWALQTPDAVAYESVDGTRITYAAFERTVDAVARRARAAGLLPGQSAAIATADYFRFIVAALALGRIGVAFAPVTLPAHLTDVLLQDRGEPGNGCSRIVTFDEVWPDDSLASGGAEPASFHDDGAAILTHSPSSGTTGGPKFVPVSHALTLRRIDPDAWSPGAGAAGPGSPGLRQACFITESSSYGFNSALFVLSRGGTVLQPVTDARKVPEWLVRSRADHLVASPISLQRMAEAMPPLRAPNFLATIQAGGGTLAPSVHKLVSERMCANVFINYGSSECGRVAGAPARAILGKAGAVGYAYPGVEVQVVDDDGRPLPAEHEGIVRIRSERNASGYLDDAEASAVTFRHGFVYPGDRGVLEADGLLRIVGRVDDVINIGGGKVNPQTIEDAMMALGGVREVAVFGAAAEGGATVICAAIVPTAPLHADTYHERCRQRLGGLAPALIMHMRALPRNANGKVLRNDLTRMAVEAHRRRNPSG